MADLRIPDRNQVIGRIADILKQGKGYANQYAIKDWVPLIGGTGLGDMFMGKAPELADDASYNLLSLIRGGNQATGGLGTYTFDPRSADAGLLAADALGIGKGLGSLGRAGSRTAGSAFESMTNGSTSESRREALKKIGALTGSAVTGGTVLGTGRKLLDNFATDIAPKVADNVAVNTTKKYKFNSLNDYFDHVRNIADEEGYIAHAESGYDMPSEDFMEAWQHPDNALGYNSHFKRVLTGDEQAYKEAKAAGVEPKNSFSPQAKQEMSSYKRASQEGAWTDPNNYDEYLHFKYLMEP